MKAVAVTGTIMFRKTENRPKYGFKKVNCCINTSNYKCNQDLHVIVACSFFNFFQFPLCVLNIKLQDQFWKVSFVKRVSRTPLGNRIEEFNGVYAQNTPNAVRSLSELYQLKKYGNEEK